MIIVAFALTLTSIIIIYNSVFNEKQNTLHELGETQKDMIRSIYKENNDVNKIIEILYAQKKITEGIGNTGEYSIGYLENDSIKFVLRMRLGLQKDMISIPKNSKNAIPMQKALPKKTGFVEGHDYRGNLVFAYYTYIPELKWGLVTKMDISEIRTPFYKAVIYTIFFSFVLLIIATLIFKRTSYKIKKRIEESEENYRRLFEYSAIPIWREDFSEIKKYLDKLNESGINDYRKYFEDHKEEVNNLVALIKVIEINQKSVEFFEVDSKEEVIKNTLFYFIEESFDVFREELIVIAQGGRNFECEMPIRTLSGQIKILFMHISVVKGYENTLSNVLISFIDITEIKKYEKAIVEKKEQLFAVFNGVSETLILLETNGKIIEANNTALKRFNNGNPDMIGKNFYDYIPIQFHEKRRNQILELVRDKKPISFTDQLGESFMEINFYPVKDSNGNISQFVSSGLDITERIKSEEAIKRSEEQVKMKLQNLLSPDGDISNLKLSDIIDAPSIQSLMNNFHELAQIPMAIIDLEGRVLVGVGWQDACTKFHRVHPETCKNCIESDVKLSLGVPEGEYKLYKCKNNLWDITTPIIIGGEHKGNLFMGQFFFDDEQIDYDFFETQAKKYGFDEKEYISSIGKVPRISKKKLEYAKSFFTDLAQSLSQLSYSNLKLARLIEEQKITEGELKKSEEKFKVIATNTPDHILIQDKLLRYTMVINPQIGLKVDEMLGKTDFEILSHEDAIKLTEIKKKVLKTGIPEHLNAPLTSITGEIGYFEGAYVPKHDSDGNIDGIIGYFRNVTERYKIEKALHESEEQLRDILEASPVMISITSNVDSKIVFTNNTYNETFGFKAEEIIGREAPEVYFDPDEREKIMTIIKEQGYVNNYQLKAKKNDGTPFWLMSSVRTIKYYGKPAILAASIDITTSKAAEEALRNSEVKMRGILEATKESIWMFSTDGVTLLGNPTAIGRIGKSEQEIIGKKIIDIIPQEVAIQRIENLKKVEKTASLVEFEDTRDGIHFRHSYYPVLDDTGKVTAVVSFSRDITEAKKKENELNKLNNTLNALSKSSQIMTQANDEQTYLKEVCKIIIDNCGFEMVWIGYAENDNEKSVKPVAYSGFEDGYLNTLNITWADNERGNGPTGTAIKTGKPAICKDMHTDPKFKVWCKEATDRGYASSIVLPLLEEDKAFGAVSIYSKEPDSFTHDEVQLLSELAKDLSNGIINIRARIAQAAAEKALKESQDNYYRLFEYSAIPIWKQDYSELKKYFDKLKSSGVNDFRAYFDLHKEDVNHLVYLTKVVEINQKSVELFNAESKDDVIKNKLFYYNEESLDIFREEMIVLAEGGTRFECEMPIRTLSGEVKILFQQTNVVKGYEDSLANVLISFIDITQRKKAEQELKIINNKISKSEEDLKKAQSIAHMGSWKWNIKTGEVTWSDEMYNIFGIDKTSLTGRLGDAIAKAIHPDDLHMLLPENANNFAKQKTIEYRIILPNRSIRFIAAEVGDCIYNDEGNIQFLTGVSKDISEHKRFELELEEKNASLEESNATKDKFFKIIAHDMKNPFISLIGASELIYENAHKYDAKRIEKLGRLLNESAKSGYDMLLNLLEWARSQAGSMVFQPEKLNLRSLINNNLSNLKDYAMSKDISLVYDIDEKLYVNADKNMLNTILRNLINNALKFTPKGGEVIVGTIKKADSMVIFIKDTGVGIAKADFDKLFRADIKFSSQGTEHEGGTGLGLLLSKEFIEKHGGKIWLESEEGKGSTFFFTINDFASC